MIFVAKNEKDIPTWLLILDGDKTTTRRMKPMDVGKEFAVQPGRGKFAVCRARVINCMNSSDHYNKYDHILALYDSVDDYKADEARLEGFGSWEELMLWFKDHKINFMDTFRIEFKVIK